MSPPEETPHEYVQQNQQTLVRLLKHSNDEFVRALALAAIIEFGEDATLESIEADLNRLRAEIQNE